MYIIYIKILKTGIKIVTFFRSIETKTKILKLKDQNEQKLKVHRPK